MGKKYRTLEQKHSLQRYGNRLVMKVLCDRADDQTGETFPGNRLIAQETGLTERAVAMYIDDLLASPELELIQQGNGRGRPAKYRITIPEQGFDEATIQAERVRKKPKGRRPQNTEKGESFNLQKDESFDDKKGESFAGDEEKRAKVLSEKGESFSDERMKVLAGKGESFSKNGHPPHTPPNKDLTDLTATTNREGTAGAGRGMTNKFGTDLNDPRIRTDDWPSGPKNLPPDSPPKSRGVNVGTANPGQLVREGTGKDAYWVFREYFPRTLTEHQMTCIRSSVSDMPKWREVCERWAEIYGNDWKKFGLLDWYKNGIPGNGVTNGNGQHQNGFGKRSSTEYGLLRRGAEDKQRYDTGANQLSPAEEQDLRERLRAKRAAAAARIAQQERAAATG